jgi:hypothetical protein
MLARTKWWHMAIWNFPLVLADVGIKNGKKKALPHQKD